MTNTRIEVVAYNKEWPALFATEAKQLQLALKEHAVQIHHIGSTSIEGIAAKPIIDIQLECRDITQFSAMETALIKIGYAPLRRHIIPHRYFFTSKSLPTISFHLHICEVHDPQVARHLNFRNYMRTHKEEREQYVKLKQQLAERFAEDRLQYVMGKDKFVQAIDLKARQWADRIKISTQHTSNIHSSSTQEIIIKAMCANMNVHMTHFAQYINQVELIRVPGATIVNSGLPDDTFNYVLDGDYTPQSALEKITQICALFATQNTPFSWWVSPYDQPPDLANYLQQANFKLSENNIGMCFDLDAWSGEVQIPAELTIKRALDRETIRDFALVLAADTQSFITYYEWLAEIIQPDDPIEYYVGYVQGKPVARGLICYFAGVAGLYWLSTEPSARKKGYGQAMQLFRLKLAKDKGYHLAVLQASPEGFPLYKRLGYKEYAEFKEYKLNP